MESRKDLIYLSIFTVAQLITICALKIDRIISTPLDLNIPVAVEVSNISIFDHDSIVACRVKRSAGKEKSIAKYDIFDADGPFNGNMCTHLIYGPFYVNETYQLDEDCNLDDIKNISKRFPHLKLMLEVTYRKNNSNVKMLTSLGIQLSTGHLEFIKNMKNTIKLRGFHGIFLEKSFYLTVNGLVHYRHYLANIKPNKMEILAQYMRDSFKKDGLLVATEMELYPKSTVKTLYKELQKCLFLVSHGRISELSHIYDFVVIKGYQPSYRENNLSSYNAPLFSEDPEYFNIYDRLKIILFNWGGNPNKLILSVPFFGLHHLLINSSTPFGYNESTYSKGFAGPLLRNKNYWGYNEICRTTLLNKNVWKMYWDRVAKVPFLKKENHWLTFDNSKSIAEKVDLAMELGLKGIMPFTIDTDDFHGQCAKVKHPLLKTVNYAIKNSTNRKNSLSCLLLRNETLKLQHVPLVSMDFFILTVSLNTTVTINCSAEGYPEIDVEISKDGKILETNSSTIVEKGDCMTRVKKTLLMNIELDSAGKYSCTANTSVASSRREFFLQLKTWPFILYDNEIWIEKTRMDLNIPHINNSVIVNDQTIVCKVSRQPNKSKSGNHGKYFDIQRIPKLIHEELCTLIIYGPFYVNRKYEIIETNTTDLERVKNLTEKYADVKILLEITIEPSFKNADSEYLPIVNYKFKQLIRKFGFSGVHFDWSIHYGDEGDTAIDRKRNYATIVQTIKQEFKEEGLIVTTEVEMYSKSALKVIDDELFSEISSIFDMIILKSYNFHKSSKFNTAVHNSPLEFFAEQNEDARSNLEHILNRHKAKPYSLLLGIPFFGYRYSLENPESHAFGFNDQPAVMESKLGYNDICHSVSTLINNWTMFWDNIARVPFIKTGRSWITFDTPKSIYEKIRFYSSVAQKFKLRGIVVDSIDNDDFLGECSKVKYPLLKTVYDALNRKPDSETWSTEWWWIFSIFSLLFISIFLVIAFVLLYRKNPPEGLTRKEIKEFLKGSENLIEKIDEVEKNPDHLPYNTLFEIAAPNYKIEAQEVLGCGAYGIVFKGEVNGKQVAVKSVKPGADKQYLKSLLSELKILIYIGKHENIVNLIGASTTQLKKGNVYIFVELCPIGNLQDFLRSSRPLFRSSTQYCNFREEKKAIEEGGQSIITTDNLIIWCYQVAKGLQHLSEKKIIHGDLATRNILVFEMSCVKITDFGLSRKLYNYSDYVKKNEEPLPWRWMAIESLRDLIFSFQSDVWSFGITMWEIFTLAEVPYPGLSWTTDFVDLLKKSLRMQKPTHATDNMYAFMLDCWRENPQDRPKPQEVTKYFFHLVKSIKSPME